MATVLQHLVAAPLKDLHRKRADGSRHVDALYQSCLATGAAAAGALGPKERLFAVFDAALSSNSGFWLLDYVSEVCGDRSLTSDDALEAQLLDGSTVAEWAGSSLRASEEKLQAALKSDALLTKYISTSLSNELSKANTLCSTLHALARIHGAGAMAGSSIAFSPREQQAGSTATGSRAQRGVQSELQQALLLQQALQMLAWCVRHRLHERPHTGRFSSMPEWLRRVQGRRERRPGRSLFLDDMLQALSISGAYPFSSLPHALFTLACVVRDPSPKAWSARLGVLAYYLSDLGLLHEGQGQAGGAQLEGARLMDDFRATFGIPAAQLAAWQAAFLLDSCPTAANTQPSAAFGAAAGKAGVPGAAGAAEGGQGSDEELSRACALLLAHVQPELPIKFIEVLVALGQPDVALAVDRAQSGGSGGAGNGQGLAGGSRAAGLSLQQARVLVELRLRCGLLAEALHLARAHAADQPDAAARQASLSALVSAIGEWAVARQQQASAAAAAAGGAAAEAGAPQWARSALLEMCMTEEEEGVLVGWLVSKLEAGHPASDFLPILLAARGRVPEALGAFKRWADRQGTLAPPAPTSAAALLHPLIDRVVDVQANLLPQPLRNVVLDGGVTAPLRSLPPGPAGLCQGFVLQNDVGVPSMQAGFMRCEAAAAGGEAGSGPGAAVFLPPPFITTRIPAPAPSEQVAGAGAGSGQEGPGGVGSGVQAEAEDAAQQQQQGGSTQGFTLGAWAPPPTSTMQSLFGGGGGAGAAGGASYADALGAGALGGAGRSLFSLGVPGLGVGAGPDLGLVPRAPTAGDVRVMKRPRTNAWFK